MPPGFDAVILAGGRGTRLGGADKPGLIVGTSTMAAAVLGAVVSAGARRAVLVGPDRPELSTFADALPDGLSVVREDPPGCGPVPALRAGLTQVDAPWVLVLAADLPFLHDEQIGELLAAAWRDRPAGVIMADDAGAAQWLTGCWQADRLRSGLAGYDGSSLRGLFGPLNPLLIRYPAANGAPPPWLDCDTPAELAAARGLAEGAGTGTAAGPGGDCVTADSRSIHPERQASDHT